VVSGSFFGIFLPGKFQCLPKPPAKYFQAKIQNFPQFFGMLKKTIFLAEIIE
jgi:hypothetical protein